MSELVKKQGSLSSRIATAIIETGETYDVLAKNLSVSRNTIMTYKKGQGDIKGVVIESLVKCYNFNPSWLLTGEGPIYKDTKSESNRSIPPSEKKDIIVIDHSDLVKEFEDQERARKINQNLIKIEKQNKQAFRDIDNYIQGVANGLKYSSKKTPATDNKGLPGRKIS